MMKINYSNSCNSVQTHKKVAVIIVTHNSQAHLDQCLQSIAVGTVLPEQILIADSGSKEVPSLAAAGVCLAELFLCEGNIGYAAANNQAFAMIQADIEYVLFLNPDAFCRADTLETAIRFMEAPQSAECGAVSGALLGYDFGNRRPSEQLDSTGIFVTAYGRFYDRLQGRPVTEMPVKIEEIPACCGAFMFCRRAALQSVLLRGREVFDETFFMYKEDIDLSLRLRRAGYQIFYVPSVQAYHCRGWQVKRQNVPFWAKRCSLYNDWRLWKRSYLSFWNQMLFLLYLFVKTVVVLGWESWQNKQSGGAS